MQHLDITPPFRLSPPFSFGLAMVVLVIDCIFIEICVYCIGFCRDDQHFVEL